MEQTSAPKLGAAAIGGNIKDAPNVKKRKVVKDSSSDDEYSSNYMTGHIVKRLKKYEAKMAALKASKAQKYPVVKPKVRPIVSPIVTSIVTPIVTSTVTSIVSPIVTSIVTPIVTSTVTSIVTPIVKPIITSIVTLSSKSISPENSSTFTPITLMTSKPDVCETITRPIPTPLPHAFYTPIASTSSSSIPQARFTPIHLSNYKPSSSVFKPISKSVEKPPVKPIGPLKPLIQKKQSWPDLLQPNKSKPSTVRPLDTLQLIKNMGITTLRVTKKRELPVTEDKSEEPPTKKPNNDSVKDVGVVIEVPQFKFSEPIVITEEKLKDPEDFNKPLVTKDGGNQTDEVEDVKNYVKCYDCTITLTKENVSNNFKAKCSKCEENDISLILPPSTNRITSAALDSSLSVCKKCAKETGTDKKTENIEIDGKESEKPEEKEELIVEKIPERKVVTPQILADWKCEVCSALNEKLRSRCLCCEAHKPGTNFMLEEINIALKEKNIKKVPEIEQEIEKSVILPPPEPIYKPIPIRHNANISKTELTPPLSPSFIQCVPEIPAISTVITPSVEIRTDEIKTPPTTESQKLTPSLSDDGQMDEEPFPVNLPVSLPASLPVSATKETAPPMVFSFGKPVEMNNKETQPSFAPPTVNPALFKFGSSASNESSNVFGQPVPFTFSMGNSSKIQTQQTLPMYRNVAKKPHSFGNASQTTRSFTSPNLPKANIFDQNMSSTKPAGFQSPLHSNMQGLPQNNSMFQPMGNTFKSPFGDQNMFSPATTNMMPMQRSVFGNIAPVAPMMQMTPMPTPMAAPVPTARPAAFNFSANTQALHEDPSTNVFSSGPAQPGTAPANRKYRRAARRMPR